MDFIEYAVYGDYGAVAKAKAEKKAAKNKWKKVLLINFKFDH